MLHHMQTWKLYFAHLSLAPCFTKAGFVYFLKQLSKGLVEEQDPCTHRGYWADLSTRLYFSRSWVTVETATIPLPNLTEILHQSLQRESISFKILCLLTDVLLTIRIKALKFPFLQFSYKHNASKHSNKTTFLQDDSAINIHVKYVYPIIHLIAMLRVLICQILWIWQRKSSPWSWLSWHLLLHSKDNPLRMDLIGVGRCLSQYIAYCIIMRTWVPIPSNHIKRKLWLGRVCNPITWEER